MSDHVLVRGDGREGKLEAMNERQEARGERREEEGRQDEGVGTIDPNYTDTARRESLIPPTCTWKRVGVLGLLLVRYSYRDDRHTLTRNNR